MARKRYESPMPTRIFNMPYDIDENETEVEVEYDYDSYDPGDAWCPPSGGNAEISETMYVVVRKGNRWVRTGETRDFSDLPGDVQDEWQEECANEAAGRESEAKAYRRARKYRHTRGFEEEYL